MVESVTKGLGGLIPGLGGGESQPATTPEAAPQPSVADQAPAQPAAPAPAPEPAPAQQQPPQPSVEETIQQGIGGALKGLFGD